MGTDASIEVAAQAVLTAAERLIAAAKAARQTELNARRTHQATVEQPWLKNFDAACEALVAWCATNRRAIEDAHRLIVDRRADLVDLDVVRTLRDLYTEADTLRRQRPDTVPMTTEGLLALRQPIPPEVSDAVELALGPPLSNAYSMSDEGASRWKVEVLGELPAECWVSGSGLLFEQPTVRARLEAEAAEEPVTVT